MSLYEFLSLLDKVNCLRRRCPYYRDVSKQNVFKISNISNKKINNIQNNGVGFNVKKWYIKG